MSIDITNIREVDREFVLELDRYLTNEGLTTSLYGSAMEFRDYRDIDITAKGFGIGLFSNVVAKLFNEEPLGGLRYTSVVMDSDETESKKEFIARFSLYPHIKHASEIDLILAVGVDDGNELGKAMAHFLATNYL